MDKTINNSGTLSTTISGYQENMTMIKLIDNFNLFVAATGTDKDSILSVLVDGPVADALRGNTTTKIGDIELPIMPRSLAQFQPATCALNEGEVVTNGVALRLPADLALLTGAKINVDSGMPFDFKVLFKTYQFHVAEIVGWLIQEWAKETHRDGIQTLAQEDIRLNMNQIGASHKTMKRLQALLAKTRPELSRVKSIHGLWMLNEGFPVAGPECVRPVQFVVLRGVKDGFIYHNPEAWQDKVGRDTDGDQAFATYDGMRFTPAGDLGDFPKVAGFEGFNNVNLLMKGGTTMLTSGAKEIKPWSMLTPEQAVERVMNMTIKRLTGPLTYGFHVIGRAAGVQIAKDSVDPKETYRQTLIETYEIFFPMIELVMDAKKMEGGTSSLINLASALQAVVNGKVVDVTAFDPFLAGSPKLLGNLHKMLHAVGYSLNTCRNTGYGTVVAAGRKLPGNVAHLIRRMLKASIPTAEMLPRLQADALGEEFCFLHRSAAPENKPVSLPTVEVEDGKGIDGMLLGIKVNGQSVFTKIINKENVGGHTIRVTAFFLPTWLLGGTAKVQAHKIILNLPFPEKASEEGHQIVRLSGGGDRLYQPRFILKGEEVVKEGFMSYMREALVKGVTSVIEYTGKLTVDRIETRINQAIITSVNNLTESNPQNNLVALNEFRVHVPESGDIQADWRAMEQIIAHLSVNGFDVVTTSKNKPGEVVTKANEFGLPARLMEVCPLARFMDSKRRVEFREIRKALPLFNPGTLPLRLAGSDANWFAPYLFVANTAIFNCNLNVFTREDGTQFQHDTLIGTASLEEKMALKSQTIPVKSMEEKADLIKSLLDQGFKADQIEVIEVPEVRGRGLIVNREAVKVSGKILDIGKIKSAVGAVKGIPHIVPVQFFAVDAEGNREVIDLIVPKETAEKKLDLAMVAGMKLAAAGITEVEADVDLESLLDTLPANTGVKTIVAVYEDGTQEILGETLVGPVPFFRPVQTSFSLFKERSGTNGISIPTHALVMLGKELSTPKWVNTRFTQAVEIMKEMEARIRGGNSFTTDEAPMPSDSDVPVCA